MIMADMLLFRLWDSKFRRTKPSPFSWFHAQYYVHGAGSHCWNWDHGGYWYCISLMLCIVMHVCTTSLPKVESKYRFTWFRDFEIDTFVYLVAEIHRMQANLRQEGYNGRLFCGHTCTASNAACRQTSATWTSKCMAQLWASLLFNGLSFSSSSYLRRWTTSHGTVILCLGYQWMTLEPVWHVERLPHVASCCLKYTQPWSQATVKDSGVTLALLWTRNLKDC